MKSQILELTREAIVRGVCISLTLVEYACEIFVLVDAHAAYRRYRLVGPLLVPGLEMRWSSGGCSVDGGRGISHTVVGQ